MRVVIKIKTALSLLLTIAINPTAKDATAEAIAQNMGILNAGLLKKVWLGRYP